MRRGAQDCFSPPESAALLAAGTNCVSQDQLNQIDQHTQPIGKSCSLLSCGAVMFTTNSGKPFKKPSMTIFLMRFDDFIHHDGGHDHGMRSVRSIMTALQSITGHRRTPKR